MTMLLSDTRVTEIPVRESGEPLTLLREFAADHASSLLCGASVLVREGLAHRLVAADQALGESLSFKVVEGFRAAEVQERIIDWYIRHLAREYPEADHEELRQLSSRFVAPLDVAPHVAGAAVDLTIVDVRTGLELDMGTAVDATPEDSDGACYFEATGISPAARRNRDLLSHVLERAGLVNYPTEWWHWSYGDRYWAQVGGHSHAIYGPAAAGGGR